MAPHPTPQQCLANLRQEESDGGREEYLEQETRIEGEIPPRPTGDCAVVALEHATFQPVTGKSYREAREQLAWAISPHMYNLRRRNETSLKYRLRMIKQWLRPPERNPVHMTPSHAIATCLFVSGYQHIYPNRSGTWFCICDTQCT